MQIIKTEESIRIKPDKKLAYISIKNNHVRVGCVPVAATRSRISYN